jgi:2-oxoglutarate ferredoxin oxidoreductase subunit gamma
MAMKTDVILAGFGGQGMLLIGKLLSLAAMDEGKEVCWLPSYGPEMRGGTANVTVTISDDPIGSPVVSTPSVAAVMNQPSLEKFGPALVKGGLLIVNESLVKVRADREDISVMYLPANDLANGIGTKRSPNIVVLGAYVALTGVVGEASVHDQIRHQFGRKPQIAELNLRAFQLGVDAARDFVKKSGRKVLSSTSKRKSKTTTKRSRPKAATTKPATKAAKAPPKRTKSSGPKRAASPKPAKATAKRAAKRTPKRAAAVRSKRTTKRG